MMENLSRRGLAVPLAAAFAVLATLAAVMLAGWSPRSAASRPDGAQQLGDPDYGVCRGTDPRCYHDWGNFDPAAGYRVLLYTRTAGPRHANLGPALAAGLNPPLTAANIVQNGVIRLGEQNGFAVDWTEDVTRLASAGQLFRYNAVVFFSTSRDTLDDAAQTGLRQYVRGGGGFVGAHNAFGTEYNWPWYEGLLGGANYYDHGPAQPGTVRAGNSRWEFVDEWYNLVPYPSRVRVLATVDESSLAEGVAGGMGHPGHGRVHPVAWCQYYDGGRAWLTTLGHDTALFADDSTLPGAARFRDLLLGGIESAMGKRPFCR